MTREEAQKILNQLKAGKKFSETGPMNYTGDYTLYEVYYKAPHFVYECYDCHNDAGEFLIRSSEMDEERATKYFMIMDFKEANNHLR